MRFLRRQPIRRQIVGTAILLLLTMVAVSVWSVGRSLAEREVEVGQQAVSLATISVAYLNEYLGGLDSMAAALVRHPSVIALGSRECHVLFVELLRDQPLLSNVLLTNADGVPVASGLPIPPGLERTASWPSVSQVISTGRPLLGPLLIGPITHRPLVVLAYPVRASTGTIIGAVGFAIDLTRLQTVFSRVPLPEGSVVTLADRTSRILARSREAERYIGQQIDSHPVEPALVPVMQIRRGIDGMERFYGNAVVERGPWLLSVGIPRTVATARQLPQAKRNAAILSTAVAIALCAVLWTANRLSRQFARLGSAAQRIAAGDLTPPPTVPAPNRELADLQDAFVTMAARLRDARDAAGHQMEQERKMRELLVSLQRQVVRQERLAAVGVLVSGVAHELNNPLQAILGTTEVLERQYGLPKEVLEELAFIKTQSGRARDIIRNLSRFSAQQSGPPTPVDLRDVVAEVIQLRRRELQSTSIALDVETASMRPVFANFTELEQVVLNFVINAQQSIADAGRSRGRILIRLVDDGRNVCLEVMDDGPGVSPDDEPKLFQPFFTTKPVGQGTGLGLSVSYGIIDSYGGTIGHRSNQWGGATFFFELPAADAAGEPQPIPGGR